MTKSAYIDIAAHPPRRASTRWSVAPPSRLYSEAVLSSALLVTSCQLGFVFDVEKRRNGNSSRSSFLHLLAAEDESLLDRGDSLLLLDTLLYPGDLYETARISICAFKERGCSRDVGVVSIKG